MTYAGRVEAQMTVPAGESISATNTGVGGGTSAVALTAGAYYPTDFVAHVVARLNAVRTPATWSGSLDTLTGQVTFNWTGAGGTTYAMTWTTPGTEAALGFAANIGATTQGVATTGMKQALGLWIPNHPLVSDVDSKQAPTETDLRDVESPTGETYSLGGVDRYVHTGLSWDAVPINRVWISEETTANQSYERFFLDAIRGNGSSWWGIKRPMRIYDARGAQLGQAHAISAWKLSKLPDLARLRMFIPRFTGYVKVEWPRLLSAG